MPPEAFYGSREGGWLYPPTPHPVGNWPVNLGLLLSIAGAVLVWASYRYADRRPALVLAAWLVLGTAGQVAVRTFAYYPDAETVATNSNGFYQAAGAYPPGRFLREFRAIAPTLNLHVRANLAGKVLFYHLLRGATDSPAVIAWLILAASNVGALLAYGVARELFADRTAGVAAAALYLFLPTKLFFQPLLNTVTPVFVLLPLWLLVRHLGDRRPGWLAALGAALYALVLFEPLPLVTGLVFVGLIGRAWARGDVGRRHIVTVLTVVPLAFFAVDAVVTAACGYEIVGAFRFALADAREFNAQHNRPYGLWVAANLIETLGCTGVLTSLTAIGVFVVGLVRAVRDRAVLSEPGLCLAAGALASLLAADLLGVNRGETARLWIFLGAFLQLPVAGLCARRPALLTVLLAGSIVQTCDGLSSRLFVVPG